MRELGGPFITRRRSASWQLTAGVQYIDLISVRKLVFKSEERRRPNPLLMPVNKRNYDNDDTGGEGDKGKRNGFPDRVRSAIDFGAEKKRLVQ